jgi:hypothetical protein
MTPQVHQGSLPAAPAASVRGRLPACLETARPEAA